MRFSSGGKATIRNILDSTDYKHEWLLQRVRVTALEDEATKTKETITYLEKHVADLEDDRKLLLKRLWENEEEVLRLTDALEQRGWEFDEQVKRADAYREMANMVKCLKKEA